MGLNIKDGSWCADVAAGLVADVGSVLASHVAASKANNVPMRCPSVLPHRTNTHTQRERERKREDTKRAERRGGYMAVAWQLIRLLLEIHPSSPPTGASSASFTKVSPAGTLLTVSARTGAVTANVTLTGALTPFPGTEVFLAGPDAAGLYFTAAPLTYVKPLAMYNCDLLPLSLKSETPCTVHSEGWD